MNQNQPSSTQQPLPKNNNKGLVIGLIIGCLAIFIIIGGILAAMVLTNLNSSRNKAKDAQIKSSINTLRNSAEIYYDENKSYKGYVANPQYTAQVEQSESKVIIQGLSDKTYVIYAKLQSSNNLFCVDSSGFQGEISTISPSQTACR